MVSLPVGGVGVLVGVGVGGTTSISHVWLAVAPRLSVNVTWSRNSPSDEKFTLQELTWALPELMGSPPHRSRPFSVHSTDARLPSSSLAFAVNSSDCTTARLMGCGAGDSL